jgi:hypothetical protein
MQKVLKALFPLFLAGSLLAQTNQKPNFGGVWQMVKEKSDFGNVRMPDRVVRTIDHHGITINLHTEQTIDGKSRSSDVIYYTDGRDSENEVNGHQAMNHCFWDGETLVIRTAATQKGEAALTEERWTLEPDGKTLTMTSHVKGHQFEGDFKLVCEKMAAR